MPHLLFPNSARRFAFPRLALATAALALALVLASPGRAAPGVPVGPALAVSAEDGYFLSPAATVDPAGQLIVVWYGDTPAQPGTEIYARRFSPGGAPLGPAFRVNAATVGSQRRPSVGADADGGFVVAWDTNTQSVWARRFGPDGAPLSGDIAVSQSAASHRDPALAVAPDGSFAVAWELADPSSADGDILLRRFDATGTPIGAERVPYDTAADSALQLNPALAPLPGGALALVWEQTSLTSLVADSTLWLQRLDATGSLAGAAQLVASSNAEELRDPALATGADGRTLIAWSTFTAAGGAIYARRYGPDGQPLADGFRVSQPETAARFTPSIAVAADGSAVIAWVDSTLRAGVPVGVLARRLDAAGAPEGDELAPRTAANGASMAAAVAVAIGPGSTSPLWLTWSQPPPADASATLSAIYARRYVERFFQLALPLVRR